MIDKEIEYLILYFTPSVRRNNDELGTVMTKVIQNEKILQMRNMEEAFMREREKIAKKKAKEKEAKKLGKTQKLNSG